jgi:hypothetical protein
MKKKIIKILESLIKSTTKKVTRLKHIFVLFDSVLGQSQLFLNLLIKKKKKIVQNLFYVHE